MLSHDPSRQSSLPGELSVSDGLDLAFLRSRRTWGGTARLLALTGIALAGGVGTMIWLSLRRDLIVSGGTFIPAETMWTLSLVRLAQVALYGVLGIAVAERAYRRMRGPLRAPPDRQSIVRSALGLIPLWTVLVITPHLLILGPALLRGEASLIPVEGTLSIQPFHWPVLVLWLLLPPYFRLAPPALAVEGGGPAGSLVRSASLAARSGGRAHGLQVLATLLVATTAAGLALLLHALFPEPELDRIVSPWAGLSLETGLLVAFAAALPLAEALWMPQIQDAWFLSYVEARVRLEGLDVERAGHLAGLLEGEGDA